MNYNETKDLTKQYLLARIPFIAINSIEKKRVERMFLELSKEMNIPIYFYSMSKGLFEITSGKVLNETKTTTGVLDYIGEQLKIKELKNKNGSEYSNKGYNQWLCNGSFGRRRSYHRNGSGMGSLSLG